MFFNGKKRRTGWGGGGNGMEGGMGERMGWEERRKEEEGTRKVMRGRKEGKWRRKGGEKVWAQTYGIHLMV